MPWIENKKTGIKTWRSDEYAGHLKLNDPKHVAQYDKAVAAIRKSGIKGIKIDRKGAIAGNPQGQAEFKKKKAAAKGQWAKDAAYRNIPVTKGIADKARVYVRARATSSGMPSDRQVSMARKIMAQHLSAHKGKKATVKEALVSELNTTTLHSYTRKALPSMATHASDAAVLADKGDHSNALAKRSHAKALGRQIGIHRAVNKIAARADGGA
jgi:hypothetical protein